MYDYIIIGAGMAGLYCTFRLHQKGYNAVCFEASSELGGRALERDLGGTMVKLGGGICDDESIHLSKLLDELNIERKYFNNILDDSHLPFHFDMNDAINQIIAKYHHIIKEIYPNSLNLSVNDFLTEYFGEEFRDLYYEYTEYLDYKNQDINDYILRYPIKDEYRIESELFSFSYKKLIEKLFVNVIYERVSKIDRMQKGFLINDKYKTENVIVCTTILDAKKLFDYPFLNQIGSVPFCRMYSLHDEKLTPTKGMVMVNNELNKYTRINDHIMMTLYADGEIALFWKEEMENNRLLESVKERFPSLPPIKEYIFAFWHAGIHYFKPDPENQFPPNEMRNQWLLNHMNPEPGIYFAGEYFSDKGGWVEGAIRSVDLFIDHFI